eukprot:TRINITY_DN4332_c0_g1_i1.p1 TRINITY_DN4332_c0_g1~~TRINITY_DN4332_c0_g1_i1.p1  ORF type:complete len:112 (-),score=6.07 TRINITY_DN4332_c0_g1_i1:58-393(-)
MLIKFKMSFEKNHNPTTDRHKVYYINFATKTIEPTKIPNPLYITLPSGFSGLSSLSIGAFDGISDGIFDGISDGISDGESVKHIPVGTSQFPISHPSITHDVYSILNISQY